MDTYKVETVHSKPKGNMRVGMSSRIRVTHIESETIAECGVGGSQYENRETCFKMLKAAGFDARA